MTETPGGDEGLFARLATVVTSWAGFPDRQIVSSGDTDCGLAVIKTFLHKGIRRFFETGSHAVIQSAHADRLGRLLAVLDAAASSQDMNLPGWRLHALQGRLSGHWSVRLSGNWRLTFRFEGKDAVLVDYQDYH